MNIIAYDEKYKSDFIRLNTAWIEKYFGKVEQTDYEEFHSIDNIIRRGGMIFFVLEDGKAISTIMANPLENATWELCKLATDERYEGRGAGGALFEAAMQYAKEHGAKRLFILSNDCLKPALHLYRKHNFRQLSLDDYTYERGNIAFEYLFDEV